MIDKNKYLKIIISVLLIIVLAVGGFFLYKKLSSDNSNKNENNKQEVIKPSTTTITPLLFEVTKEGSSNKMYLFGSIHATKKEDLVFPDYVLNAYNNSHYLACEYDIVAYEADMEKVLSDTLKMINFDGTKVSDHISESLYNKIKEFFEKHKKSLKTYNNYNIFVIYSLIANMLVDDAKLSSNNSVDSYFIKKAKQDNKIILEVESSDYQYDIFNNLPDELYELMISEELDNYDESIDELLKLYETWKKGTYEDLEVLANEEVIDENKYSNREKALVKEFNEKVIYNRNKNMVDKAIEYFSNNQDVFFIVGEFHIVGDTGLVNELRERGYIVTQVE